MEYDTQILSGSKLVHQRRLFTGIYIKDVLESRRELAKKQFARGVSEGDIGLLIERIFDRFEAEAIWLADEIIPQTAWDIGDGTKEGQFTIRFGGDALFWDCSPVPIDDVLPSGCTYMEWFLPPGETLQHPYGEIFRDELILIRGSDICEDDLASVRHILWEQERIIDKSNEALLLELHELADLFSHSGSL